MQPKALKYIYDIQASAQKIRRFVAGKSLESYLTDELLQSAVERQFEIIGEAINLLCKTSPEVPGRFRITER